MATVDSPEEERRDVERRAHLAMSVHRYVDQVEEIISRLDAGEFDQIKDLRRVRGELMTTVGQLRSAEIDLEQQRKRDESRRASEGGPIDIGAARDAIGRRLDSLRAASGPGSVSGEPGAG